jgi:hypothetical protein
MNFHLVQTRLCEGGWTRVRACRIGRLRHAKMRKNCFILMALFLLVNKHLNLLLYFLAWKSMLEKNFSLLF